LKESYYGTGKNQHQCKSRFNTQKNSRRINLHHKDAYELGAKLIAIGDAEETMEIIDTDPVLQKLIKQNEYKIIQAKKEQLEKELKDL